MAKKIHRIKIIKKQRYGKKGGRPRSASLMRLGRKIIYKYAGWDKKGNKYYLKYSVSLYSKLFCVKQPYFIWLHAGAPPIATQPVDLYYKYNIFILIIIQFNLILSL